MEKRETHCSFALQKPLYDNCQLLDAEGTLLSTCNQKKVQWYVDRSLGTIVKENPLTLQLNFTPKHQDKWNPSKVYYCHDKENMCVVCGCAENLSRKYIVPSEYRKYLEGTSHSSHDILLFCRLCHFRLNESQQMLRKSLCLKYQVQWSNAGKAPKFLSNEAIRKVQQAGRTLKKHRATLPEFRITELSEVIKSFYNITQLTDEDIEKAAEEVYVEVNNDYEPHGKELIEAYKKFHQQDSDALKQFEKLWRQHFLDNMKPQHLPLDWSVDHGHC